MKTLLEKYLYCLNCRYDIKEKKAYLVCENCGLKYKKKEGIITTIPHLTPDIKLSIDKWDSIYKNILKNKTYYENYKYYIKMYYDDTYNQLQEVKKFTNSTYLELGCGPFFLGQTFAKKCKLVIGIDFCPSALKIAKKMLDEKGVKNYILIQGDILKMPLKDNTVDIVYGGGVIEHFKNTQVSVNEYYRILKKGGVAFNTVPYLNVGSLTYRQVWGNIPNAPVLKQIAESIHMGLLKGKHMKFGYEMSFSRNTLRKLHKEAKFKKIRVDNFTVNLAFDFLPNSLRKPSIWLAKNSRLFWPMVKVIAQK